MTDQTDKDLAYQLDAALIPLGAQWAELEAVVHGEHASSILKAFGEQLAEIEGLMRLAAQRLEATAEVESDAQMAIAAIAATRRWAKEGLNIECTFVDDNMRLLVILAQRAVLAGLAGDFPNAELRLMKDAAEPHRATHEASLGFSIIAQLERKS